VAFGGGLASVVPFPSLEYECFGVATALAYLSVGAPVDSDERR
jgi:hypothetical protein